MESANRNAIRICLSLIVALSMLSIPTFGYEDGPNPSSRALSDVHISEFLALNDNINPDSTGNFSDWIELFNPTGSSVDLQGWALTDNSDELKKWIFPSVSIPQNGFLVVFCSGKNLTGSELHTNFKLTGSGEYLGLAKPDGTVIHEFSPTYPKQSSDISYGMAGGSEAFFSPPTPSEPNGPGYQGFAEGITFSQDHGFFDSPFTVSMSTASQGATIRYTTDGTEPTATNGQDYSGPITVSSTTCLRAAAFVSNWLPSPSATGTYIFLDDVLTQPSNPSGYPATWGWDEFAEPPEWTSADYEMDQEVVNSGPWTDASGTFTMKDALLSLPSISIVMDKEDLFNTSEEPDTGGIYSNSQMQGVAWERPCSIEYMDPQGSDGFQINCGIRLYGGMGRSDWFKKNTFRLFFKSDYGPSTLEYDLFGGDAVDEFNTVILRANFNDAWPMLWDDWKMHRVQMIRDEWMRSSSIDMGMVGSHGTFAHLYVNGMYWGLYNPVERPDASFSASYQGGEREDWDGLHDGEPIEGDREAWNRIFQQAEQGLSTPEAYWKVQGCNPDGTFNPSYEKLVDVENLIDYMILNFYAGIDDWDFQNWYAGRIRDGSQGYQIYVWDGEISNMELEGGAHLLNMNNPGCPTGLFQALRQNPEFRNHFALRVQKHLYGDGVLSPKNAAARYKELADTIDRAVVAESARWGDAIREEPFTRDNEWVTERDWLLNEYFPKRRDIVIQMFREAGLFTIQAPTLLVNGVEQNGGVVNEGDKLTMTAPNGTIYYTLDGSDPVLGGGGGGLDTIIEKGSVWQYNDQGTDLGTTWQTGPVTWPSGPAQLGFGDGDEQTVIQSGITTAYFRHDFQIDDESGIDQMTLRLLRDDGAVVYINGQEALRNNMPEGPITYDTFAFDAMDTENSWLNFQVPNEGVLVDGPNTIAVEVHQHSAQSSDISFDLELGYAGQSNGSISSSAVEYNAPITIDGKMNVKARATFQGGTGKMVSALRNATFTIGAPLSNVEVVINELMASNTKTIQDPDGTLGGYPDWVELYNPGSYDADLSELYLTDDVTDPVQWAFPNGTTIPSKGYLLVWCDNDPDQSGTWPHSSFRLSAGGESLYLLNTDGVTEIDSVTFPKMGSDISYGRLPDGSDNWTRMNVPTPGWNNTGAGNLEPPVDDGDDDDTADDDTADDDTADDDTADDDTADDDTADDDTADDDTADDDTADDDTADDDTADDDTADDDGPDDGNGTGNQTDDSSDNDDPAHTNRNLTLGPFLDAKGDPLHGAEVVILSVDGPSLVSTTDEEGFAVFEEGAAEGTYSCSVILDGKVLIPSFTLEVDHLGEVELPEGGIPAAANSGSDDDDGTDPVEGDGNDNDESVGGWIIVVIALVILMVVMGVMMFIRPDLNPFTKIRQAKDQDGKVNDEPPDSSGREG